MKFRLFPLSPVLMLLLAVVWVAGMPVGARGADEEKPYESKSPGGRFVFRKLEEAGYGVVSRKSGKAVAMGENAEGIVGVGESVPSAEWAADGVHLAVNYRAGGRYETTQLYVWTGKKFAAMGDVEELLTGRVEKDRAAFLKKQKLPAKTNLRRIWDTYRTLRWVDEKTVEVYVHSIRTFIRKEGGDEPEDMEVGGVFTVRYDKEGKPKVIDRREATKKESEGE